MTTLFHFIRPEALITVIPLIILSWLLLRQKRLSKQWQSVVDAKLLPHLLRGKISKTNRTPVLLFFICGLIGIIALAGPAWNKLPQPVFKQQSAVVIILDLSASMDASDIKPTRLTRAKHKISDILQARKEGQTALIGYAANAFTISPLTDDTATIEAMVPSLSSDLMPAQGSRIDLALNKADELLKNAGVIKGDILLLSDGMTEKDKNAFEKTHNAGHRISILGIGTSEGAPIKLANGGFLKDNNGSIVIPKLNSTLLRDTARRSGGRFSTLTADDSDIRHILGLLKIDHNKTRQKKTQMQTDVWQEEGPWLLLLLIPFVALSFRKGYLYLLLVFILPIPQPVYAFEWNELWLNDNQRAAKKFEQKKNHEAADLFNDAQWKASAYYKAGEYEQALKQLQSVNNAEAHYNRGNTLAKLGRFDEAIKEYEKVLTAQPDHKDALFNKKVLEKEKKRQQQNTKKNKGSSSEKKPDEQGNKQKNQSGQSASNQGKPDPENDQGTKSKKNSAKKNNKNKESQNKDKSNKDTQKQTDANKEKNGENTQKTTSASPKEQQQAKRAAEQWLRRVPDDPGGLLRNKFQYLYQQQQQNKSSQQKEQQAW